MFLLFPVITFLSVYWTLRQKDLDPRRACLAASVFCAALVVAITEIASLFNLVVTPFILLEWVVAALAANLIYRRARKTRLATSPSHRLSIPASNILDRSEFALLAGAALVVAIVGIVAIVAPPDTWDAMEYHLPRITMWLSNHNVRFFPTPDYCQIIYGAWSEYAMMHTELLWGSDRFVNIVQWLSMLGSLIAVSLIAKKLGASPRGQVLAAVVCATIPEGLLEASAPMSTYVVSFWIAVTVFFLLEWNESPGWFNTVCAGLAAGLAIFTKGTAYIALPFLVLAIWCMGSRATRWLFLRRSAAFLLLIFAVNAAHYLRAYEFDGSPLGLPLPVKYPRTELVIGNISVRSSAANVLRNVSLHLVTPSRAVNTRIEHSLRRAMQSFGVNPDDPDQIWIGMPFRMNHFTSNEAIAGNPLHLILFLACVGFLLAAARSGIRRRWVSLYSAGIFASFLLMCILLRWQMWNSRYHLPLFVLGCALIGLAMERFPRPLAHSIAAVLLVIAVFLALTNRSRSLIPWNRVDDVYHPRAEMYFSNEHETLAPSQIAAATFVNRTDCRNVAIDSYVPDPEVKEGPPSFFVYPILALIHADGRTRAVWYTDVHNLSSRYEKLQPHPAPCAVICLDCANIRQKWSEYSSIGGRASVFGNLVVFSPAGQLPNADLAAR